MNFQWRESGSPNIRLTSANGSLIKSAEVTITSSNGSDSYIAIGSNRDVRPVVDTDGDGIANHIDIDDDNDGILDTVENTAVSATYPLQFGSNKTDGTYELPNGTTVTQTISGASSANLTDDGQFAAGSNGSVDLTFSDPVIVTLTLNTSSTPHFGSGTAANAERWLFLADDGTIFTVDDPDDVLTVSDGTGANDGTTQYNGENGLILRSASINPDN